MHYFVIYLVCTIILTVHRNRANTYDTLDAEKFYAECLSVLGYFTGCSVALKTGMDASVAAVVESRFVYARRFWPMGRACGLPEQAKFVITHHGALSYRETVKSYGLLCFSNTRWRKTHTICRLPEPQPRLLDC